MPASPDVPRRLLRVLVAAQVLNGLGGAAASASPLLAVAITGGAAAAGLPPTLTVAGTAAAAVGVSALSRRAGRRVGLGAALALAAVGALGMTAAGELGSLSLLLVASVAFGAGNGAALLARYAAADLGSPASRGRAIGTVIFATAFGAVAGPNLLGPAGRLATAVGLPALTGLFLVAACAYALAALLLLARLRPDPLRLAAARPQPAVPAPLLPLRRLLAAPAARVGLTTMVAANLVMASVMGMAPVHMRGAGDGLAVIGLVISLHVAGMFGPAPLSGRLTDRLGAPAVAAAGMALLAGAAVVSAVAGRHGVLFAAGLGLLGVGWDAGLIAGSTLLAASVPTAQRPRAEAAGEVGMALAAGAATAAAGPVLSLAGYGTLALAAAGVAAAVTPLLVAAARRGILPEAAPAPRLLA